MSFLRPASLRVSPRLSLLAALTASGVLLVACDADPIGGGTTGSGGSGGDDGSSAVTTSSSVPSSTSTQGQGGADVATSSSSTGGADAVGGGPAVSDSIALYGDEIPETEGGGSSSASGVGGSDPGFEADRLYLFVSDGPTSCAAPFDVDEDCPELQFSAYIGLPPEYQVPGTYDLDDPAIISNFGEWGPSDPGECQGGGGSFLDGTIQVVAIDDDEVRIVLAGTSPATLDGPHVVTFCNGGGPVDETAVIAYFPSDLPDPESGSSGVTTGGGEELLHIRFADFGQSCGDPFGNQPGPGETHHELIVAIPQSYITPGVYPLDDASIETSYYEMEENTAAVSGGASGRPGELTILAVTADTIELELTNTSYDFANGGGLVPRCTGE